MGKEGAKKNAAFISYSLAADGALALGLRNALRRFALPWYRWQSREIFLDQTGLGMTPALWPEIKRHIDDSANFILLASPAAARSPWVRKETRHWLASGAPPPWIVCTAGTLMWRNAPQTARPPEADGRVRCSVRPPGRAITDDDFRFLSLLWFVRRASAQRAGFDWNQTSALPLNLRHAYSDEPRYADLTWAQTKSQVTLRDPRFRAVVVRLTASIEGKSVEEIEAEDGRIRRRFRAVLVAVGGLFSALAIVALSLKSRADAQRALADVRRADEQIAGGVSLVAAGQWPEARQQFEDARNALALIGASTFAADVGLWDTERHVARVLYCFRAGAGPVAAASFSADGRRLVTASNVEGRSTVRVWETEGWTLERSIEEPLEVRDLAISPNGQRIAVTMIRRREPLPGDGARDFVVLDAQTGAPVAPALAGIGALAARWVGNERIVAGDSNRRVNVWDIETGQRMAPEIENSPAYVNAVAASDDGQTVVWGSDWKGSSCAGDRPVRSVAVSPDGKRQACGFSSGYTLLKNGTMPDAPPLQLGGPVIRLEFGDEGRWLLGLSGPREKVHGPEDAGAGDGRELRLWEVDTHRQARMLDDVPSDLTAATIARNGALVAAGDTRGRVTIWALWLPDEQYLGTTDLADDINSPDSALHAGLGGRLLLQAGPHGISLFSTDIGRHLRDYHLRDVSADHRVVAVAMSSDLRAGVARDNGGGVFGWELATGARIDPVSDDLRALVRAASDPSLVEARSADGAAGARGDGNRVVVFELPSRAPSEVSKDRGSRVQAITFGPSRDWLFYSDADRSLRLWQISKTDGEWFDFHIGAPRRLGWGFVETSGSTWDTMGNRITTPWASVRQLAFFGGDRPRLLVNSGWGKWMADLGWPVRARALQPEVRRAWDDLDAKSPGGGALATAARWFALEGVWDSSRIFFARAQDAGEDIDVFTMGCAYFAVAATTEPSAEGLSSPTAYAERIDRWHRERRSAAAAAQRSFQSVASNKAAPDDERHAAALYADLSAAIVREEAAHP
jgi:WD40 repeat protein